MSSETSSLDAVKSIVGSTLGIGDRIDGFTAASGQLGTIPELDSLAVVEIVTAIEEHFDVQVDESELTAEVFETFGSLSAFVDTTRHVSGPAIRSVVRRSGSSSGSPPPSARKSSKRAAMSASSTTSLMRES